MRMQKRQFRIGELAKNLGVERFVVRFWEKEFDLKPSRSDGGQRFYEEQDLETLQFIKDLLYEKGFTISGAKKVLETSTPTITAASKTEIAQSDPLSSSVAHSIDETPTATSHATRTTQELTAPQLTTTHHEIFIAQCKQLREQLIKLHEIL